MTQTIQTKKRAAIDLTNGNPLKLLIMFSIPMFIGALFQLMYNMVDSAVLGRYVSKSALAAVGATTTAHSLIMMVGNALTNGMSILVSHAWGSKNMAKVHRIVGQAFLLSAGFGILLAALAFLAARPLLELLNTPENILENAVLYLQITGGLFIGQMFYNAASSILRAIGDSKAPLYFLILCSILNIILDLLFVIAFHWNVAGVAWATVISQLVSAAACSIYMIAKYKELRFGLMDIRPDKTVLKEYAGIAVPMALQSAMLSVGMMAITYVINSFGEDIVAAYTVGGKVEQIATVLFSQLAFSFSIYSGQNFGARKFERIPEGLREASKLLAGLVALAMLIMWIFGSELCLLFVQPEEVKTIEAAVKMIRVDGSFLPMLCAIWLINSTLRGMGIIKPTVISSVLELASKIGFSFALSYFFGYIGIWFAAPLGWVIGLVPGVISYIKWKNNTITKREATHGQENESV